MKLHSVVTLLLFASCTLFGFTTARKWKRADYLDVPEEVTGAVKAMVEIIDRDANGRINEDELLKFIQSHDKNKDNHYDESEVFDRMEDFFGHVDIQRVQMGFLLKDIFETVTKKGEEGFFVQQLMDVIDENDDGVMSTDEAVAHVSQILVSARRDDL